MLELGEVRDESFELGEFAENGGVGVGEVGGLGVRGGGEGSYGGGGFSGTGKTVSKSLLPLGIRTEGSVGDKLQRNPIP